MTLKPIHWLSKASRNRTKTQFYPFRVPSSLFFLSFLFLLTFLSFFYYFLSIFDSPVQRWEERERERGSQVNFLREYFSFLFMFFVLFFSTGIDFYESSFLFFRTNWLHPNALSIPIEGFFYAFTVKGSQEKKWKYSTSEEELKKQESKWKIGIYRTRI